MSIDTKFSVGNDALWRIHRVLNAVDVCPATWWQWVRDGVAPKGIKLSHRITVWRASEIHKFIEKLATVGLE